MLIASLGPEKRSVFSLFALAFPMQNSIRNCFNLLYQDEGPTPQHSSSSNTTSSSNIISSSSSSDSNTNSNSSNIKLTYFPSKAFCQGLAL